MSAKLFVFRVFHTLVFWFMLACLVYVLYSGITRTFNWLLLLSLTSLSTEGMVLMFNKWQCPLKVLAEKWGAEKGSVSDLFLPDIIARHTFKVSLFIFAGELILLSVRYFIG